MKRYCVDGQRMFFTDDLGEARSRAERSRPCVLLERLDNLGQFRESVDLVWWELERYDAEVATTRRA